MLRHNPPASRELDKMEELDLRDPNGFHSADPSKIRRSWLPRRTMRKLRRYLAFIVLVVLFLALWQELDPNDGGNSLRRYTRRARQRAAEMRGKGVKQPLHISWPGWNGISNIFAFGDSYSETGFNPDGPQPSPENPMGNPAWPGRTANYGPNYLGYLAGKYNESYINLYNLARGGLPGQDRILDDGNGDRIPVRNQIEDVFLPRYGRSAGRNKFATNGWRQDDSLFVFYDYVDELLEQYVLRNGDPRNVSRVLLDMAEYEQNLVRAYDLGARNFLVIGVPALEECFVLRNSPVKRTMTTFGAEGVDVNGRLAFLVQHFARARPDATVFYYDLHRVSIRTRGDPSYYAETAHIKRKEGYCYFYADRKDVVEDDEACGNPLDEFYWRDDKHHTRPFHQLMARQAVELMKDLGRAMPLEVP